jgi:hypothetical protein
MMGLSVDLSLLIDGLDMILVGALLVLVARAVSVYSLVPVTTRPFAVPAINMGSILLPRVLLACIATRNRPMPTQLRS